MDATTTSDPATALLIAERELNDANARIQGLIHEHRILRHMKFREENIRIIKKQPCNRTDAQQERLDHLVAASQVRSTALPSQFIPAAPKSVRKEAFRGVDTHHHGRNGTHSEEMKSPRRPVKSALSHVINEPPHLPREKVHGKARVSRPLDAEGGSFWMEFDNSKDKKVAELERSAALAATKHQHHLQRTVPGAGSGREEPFDRSRHLIPTLASDTAKRFPTTGGIDPNLNIATSSDKNGGPTTATFAAIAAAERARIAENINRNIKLLRGKDQFRRTESYETVSQSLRRYEMFKQKQSSARSRTKFSLDAADVIVGGDDSDDNVLLDSGVFGGIAPPSSQVVIDTSHPGPPRKYIRSGAYLIADRRRGAWEAADKYFLDSCPSRGIPKVTGVLDKGYGLMRKPELSSARSAVSSLTASQA